MVAVPAVTPVTTPDPDPMVAIPLLLLLQVLPEQASVNVVVKPGQTLSVPPIAGTNGVTDTDIVL
jgi:hypothetical protein